MMQKTIFPVNTKKNAFDTFWATVALLKENRGELSSNMPCETFGLSNFSTEVELVAVNNYLKYCSDPTEIRFDWTWQIASDIRYVFQMGEGDLEIEYRCGSVHECQSYI